jgi:hypothetical protein
MKIESSLRVFCCTETPGEPGRRRYEFGAQVRPFLPPARPLLLNFAHGAHALRFLPYQGTRPTAHFTTIPSHGRLLSSCWQSSARWSASRTSEGGDRASKTCSAVLCAGLQPKVTWVGLSLNGSPLASASVRLTPGPREGAHYELPPPSPPLPPPPSPPPPPPTAFAAPPPHCRRHLRRSHCRRHSLLPASSARQTAADAANAADASCMREPALPRARVPACVPSRARARSLHRTAPHSTQRAACAS